ncbi:ubiquitin-associated (UBA)/TS-N domain-containing protein / octicosapeptide/Phox/Bemp1 (PB1) domain-containing protein isoform X2 [Wolffia australiana]
MDGTWSSVVKVKYGNILRRFTVNVRGSQMDHDVNKLKAKISALFDLGPETSYSLTYTDEDGDLVTLVNDEELYDAVVGQRMNPLRINVQLSSEPSNLPPDNSTTRSPSPTISTAINEALKSVPDPLKSVLSKVSHDLASKASETSPAISEFVEYFSKLGLARSNSSLSGMQRNADSGREAAEKEDEVEKKQFDGQDVEKSVPQIVPPRATDPKVALSELSSFKDSFNAILVEGRKDFDEKASESKTSADQPAMGAPPAPVFCQELQDSFVSYPPLDDIVKDEVKAAPPPPQANTCKLFSPPLWGMGFSPAGDALRSFHRGVRCDGCGMHPILGPRHKSSVKANYDLCSACFSAKGNEADYIRVDRSPYRGSRPHHLRGPCSKLQKGKLDSRFVVDVTIMDGTAMAPLTPFTKIWRMRNNGSVDWPAGTQLLWIGGDQFADGVSVHLEISQAGHPVGREIDISVDFRAPARPGRYISYWRMASPFGQKFGQRVWVLIQVDEPRPASAKGTVRQELDLLSMARGTPLPMEPTTTPPNAISTASAPVVPGDLLSQAPVAQPAPAVAPGWASSLGETSTGVNSMEQTLLKELEEMGFEQSETNREILRACNYDMDKCLNELCGVSEWDPILEELQEMGFCDREKNKKLLVKNGGSIKRVVLDLVAEEKAE